MDTRHNMPYPVIPDSGANFHMFKELEFSESIPAGASAILGDGKSKLPTQGIGTKTLLIKNAWFAPTLAESIYSYFYA